MSEADRAAEEAIRALVAPRGGARACSARSSATTAATRWIVDPIDGTKNYVRGVPVWATLLALEREGRSSVAVVSAPALGRRWWATRGEGAFANGERCQVSSVARLEDATVSSTSARGMPRRLARARASARGRRAASADFWQHCLVAEGAIELAADAGLKLWDYAAVQLIVEEAGGRCTTFDGDRPAPGASFLATNGLSTPRRSRCSAPPEQAVSRPESPFPSKGYTVATSRPQPAQRGSGPGRTARPFPSKGYDFGTAARTAAS